MCIQAVILYTLLELLLSQPQLFALRLDQVESFLQLAADTTGIIDLNLLLRLDSIDRGHVML